MNNLPLKPDPLNPSDVTIRCRKMLISEVHISLNIFLNLTKHKKNQFSMQLGP